MRGAALALLVGLLTAPALAEPPEAGLPVDEDLLLEEELFLEEERASLSDPVEGWNRGVLVFNRALDTVLIGPLTDAYDWLVPDPGKRAVRRFFDNLATPPILVNDLLQLEGRRALTSGTRFLVNSTVGIAGIFDPAAPLGFEGHDADFGQTLWIYGVDSGPYLMLPLFGPATGRDAVARLVDGALRVDTWLLGGTGNLIIGVGDGLSRREMHQEALDQLARGSIDYYAALRSVYWMDRRSFLDRSVESLEEPAEVDGGSAGNGPSEPTPGS